MSSEDFKIELNFRGSNNPSGTSKDKNLVFELSFSNDRIKERRIFTLDHIRDIKSKIDKALGSYMNFIFTRR